MGYPTARDEVSILRTHGVASPETKAVIERERVMQLQDFASRVYVDEDLLHYIVALTGFTRRHPKVVLGASPRASLGLLAAARSVALLRGRTYVSPDDIREVAGFCLAHRLVLSPELPNDIPAKTKIVDEAITKTPYRRQ
jgi:MoxR-like ATPase